MSWKKYQDRIKHMNKKRISRINDEIKKELSLILSNDIKDPRLSQLISVTNVETSPDLKYCKVFVSVFSEKEKQQEALQGLKSAQGFIRSEIAKRLNLRITPEFSFLLDDSLAYGQRLQQLIHEVSQKENKKNNGQD